MSTAAEDIADPEAASDALFEALEEQADQDREFAFLADGLAIGRFGGLPATGNGAFAIVEVLRRRNWLVDYRRFASAIPHFAQEIALNETRATLRLLGYETAFAKVRGRQLKNLPPGSFVIDKEKRMFFVQSNEGARPTLEDGVGGRKRIWGSRLYDCYLVEDAAIHTSGTDKGGWIKSTLNRFAYENRTILFLTFLSNAFVVVASLSVGFIFDKVLPALALDTLFALMFGIGCLLYFDLHLRRIKADVIAHVSGRLEYIVSSTLFERLTSFRLELLTTASVSEQINRLKQFETVRDFFAGPIVAVVFELPFVVLLLGVVFFLDTNIGLILAGVVLLYALIGALIYPRIKRASLEMSTLRGTCLRLQEETVAQRGQITSRGLGKVWAARMAPKFEELSAARERVEGVWRMLNSIIAVISPLAIGAVIFFGATQVMAGTITGGILIACTILSTRLLSPVQQALVLAVRAPDVINLFRQLDGMMQIAHVPTLEATANSTPIRRIEVAPLIQLDSLVLRYPRAFMPALKGVSLRFEPGSLTCITGASGAGKSSLLRAVMGHFQAQNGTILVGSSNIDQLSIPEKTNLIGFLGHQSLQIHGTLAQNLRLTKPQATHEELRDITEEMGILQHIEAFDEGFDTRFDHQTRHRFSPSFRTKFAIAQLLLKAPKVLLLDEPESGLSDEDEALIMAALKRREGRMTSLMVTHRPSLARQADKVLVLQNGQVQFFGPPKKQEN